MSVKFEEALKDYLAMAADNGSVRPTLWQRLQALFGPWYVQDMFYGYYRWHSYQGPRLLAACSAAEDRADALQGLEARIAELEKGNKNAAQNVSRWMGDLTEMKVAIRNIPKTVAAEVRRAHILSYPSASDGPHTGGPTQDTNAPA